ncbi:MFS transporter [Actinomyces qiguomingii]|uniref:MFS transporter n=1 Tax=Actinomyces qiguomingii TaxID=2057800 RepID=UPI000FFE45E3|nr:MFS transporter [Actinomyces qiguomingii]
MSRKIGRPDAGPTDTQMDSARALATLERLPVSRWHWQVFWVLGLALQFNGILNSSGNSVLADLVDRGWSNNYWNAFFSSAMMMGFFVGSLAAGSLGDRIGRKRTYEMCILVFGSMALTAACTPGMIFLIICRGLMGIGMGGGIVLGYGTFTEFMPARVRGTWSARISLLGNLSPLIAAILAAVLIPALSWRAVFVVAGTLALAILVVVHFQLEESPRWLIASGRADDGVAIVRRAAARSGGVLVASPDDAATRPPAAGVSDTADAAHGGTAEAAPVPQTEVAVPLSAFFTGELGRRTLVATATLIAMNLSLYTITQWVPTIFVNQGIDISKSLAMSMIMMIGAPVGVFISTLIMDLLPRKVLGPGLIVLVAVLGYVYSRQTSEATILAVGTLMIVVLYVYNSFSSAVYAPEIWPTAQKMRGLGIANSIGRVVAIASPYLVAWLLTEFGVIAVFVVLGLLLSACALVLALFGIETRGRSVEEMALPIRTAKAA